MKKYETISYTAWFLLLLLFIILLFIFPPDALPANFHTVIKGDTLSGIAQKELGSWRKWKDLAEWNELKVEWKKGVPYVLIRPGQKIRLESQWTDEKIERYRLDTKYLLRREIFRMVGITRIPSPKISGRISLLIDTSNQYELRAAQKRIRGILKDLADRERLLMAEEVFSYSASMPLHFFKDEPWIAKRKTAVLLMAIMVTESHGRFVKGQHGELGPYQIKPDTYRLVMGYGKEAIPDIKLALMSSHYASMVCAIKLLKKGRNAYDALRYYNAGADKSAYALRVMRIFQKIMSRAY